jgi:hypothetical protein
MGFNLNDLSAKLTGDLKYFGFGVDGDVVIEAGTTTLTAAKQYRNLTIQAGATLDVARYIISVTGTLTIEEGATLTTTATNGSGSTGGAPGLSMLWGGGQGWDGDVVTPTVFPEGAGMGGSGGDGGAGTGGPAATGAAVVAPTGGYGILQMMPWLLMPLGIGGLTSTMKVSGGGAGGTGDGAAAAGGGGGGGGRTLWVFANTIVNNGTISAPGGNGAAGTAVDCGGGGGGGGGYVHLVCKGFMGTAPVVTGGTGGASGGGDGEAGVDGADGNYNIITLP